MALTDLTRISTSGIATGTSLSGAILHGDAHFRGTQVGVTSALFDSSDNALEFNDNVKLKFGNSGDLSIYHNGSDNYIDGNSNAEDHLYIRANVGADHSSNIHLQAKSGEESIVCRDDESVELYFNGNQKLRTTNYGAVITGILTATSFSGPVVGNTNNTSGISTFYDLRVSNNLTVEGTTTTLDTNLIGVDRVEVGANSNTVTGIAVTQSGTADIVRLYDGASQVVTVDDTGKVGIGSAIPAEKLDVAGNIKLGTVQGTNTSANLPVLYQHNDNVIHGGSGLTYNPAGDVLTVNGADISANTFRGSGALGKLTCDNHSSTTSVNVSNTVDIITVDDAADAFTLKQGSNEYITVDTTNSSELITLGNNTTHPDIVLDGAVGIHTTTPYSPLEIQGDAGVSDARITFTRHGSPSNGTVIGQNFYRIGTDSVAAIGAYRESAMDDAYLAFHTQPTGGSFAERLRITSDGSVGIGEETPDSKLDILHSSSTNPNTENLIHLRTDPGAGYVSRGLFIKIGRDGNYDNSGAYYDIVGSGSNSGFHAFQVSGNDILRITKDGNIGIGLTTTASVNVLNEPTKFRELTLGGRTEGAAIHLKDDNDNVQAGLFTSDSTNAMIIRTITNHPMMFRTNNSERLRIANDGKVGISTGVIDPNGNQLLIRAASTVGTKNAHIMLTGDSATVDQGPQIVFSESGSGSNYAGGSIGFQRKGSNSMGDLIFGTRQSTGDVNTTTTEVLRITSGGHVLFSGLTTKNDTRNDKGITIKSPNGISFQNFGANGSHNWRIRPDDLIDWGTLEFSVSPTSNSSTDWPDAASDVVLTLKPDKDVLVNNGSIEANDNTLSAISKTASSSTYVDIFVYDTRKDSDGGAWRHRTNNTSWYNETLNTSIRGARREFPQVAIIAVGNTYIHIFDADDPDMPMWMEFPAPGGTRNVMYGTGNPRCVYMLNGILCTGSQAANYWPVIIDFIRDDILGLRSATGHNHYHGRQGNISLRNSATSDNAYWWPDTVANGASQNGRISKRWWFDGVIVNKFVTSVVMSVRPEAPIDKTTGMQIPTIYLGTRGGVSVIHSNSGDTGTSYNSGVYDITSNNGPYSGVGAITITDDGYLWTLHDYYNYNSDGGYNFYRDSSAIDLKRLDNQMNDMTHSPSADTVSSLNNQGGGSANKGREYYWPSTGAEAGTHRIGYSNTWAANILERDAWGSPSGLAFVKRGIYTYDHKESSSFLVRSHQNRGLVAMITTDYNTGWHMTGNEISSCYIAQGLTSSISGANAMLDFGYHLRNLGVTGTLTRAKCATGSDLSCVSGFSSSNYARIINASLNAGNPINITLMVWIKLTDISGYSYLCSIGTGSAAMGIAVHTSDSSNGGKPYFYDSTHGSLQGDKGINDGEWHHVCGVFSCSSNRKILYVDGVRSGGTTAPSNVNYSDLDTIAVGHWCGTSGTEVSYSCTGSLALVKLGGTDLTDQQIKRIYEDEKKLFQPNAKAFLYGSSSGVTAIGYDEKKEIYHVGTSSGRSDFSGLSRINNTTTAVTTAISAYDGLIAEQ